jgi:uncharacterized membrane protein YeiH
MFDSIIVLLDWTGIVAFAVTGALVASRNQMDIAGFILLGTVTGIGGGTIRDLLLNAHPILWIEQPVYLAVCIAVSVIVFFTAHLIRSRMDVILWMDAAGLALFAALGAERALSSGIDSPLVAIVMGIITATFGGIIRDILGRERSIIFSREIYVTAALGAAAGFVALDAMGITREIALAGGVVAGFLLRAGALTRGWSLPRYRERPPASRE